MNLENFFVMAMVIALLAVFSLWLKAKRKAGGDPKSVASHALDGCNCLIQLLAHMQQHRGMSSAYLAGDRAFGHRLISKRAEIKSLLVQLQEVADAENKNFHPCFTRNDFSLFKHRWEVLVEKLDTFTIDASISAHSQLIGILLNWLDALGEARIELPLSQSLSQGCVRNYAHRLPQLAEYLGQARATGSGVAAKGACPAVARVRLMFLVSRAESLVDQACAVNQRGMAVSEKVRSLAQLTRSSMLGAQKISVSATDYFAAATAAIDAVFAWINEYSAELEGQIRK